MASSLVRFLGEGTLPARIARKVGRSARLAMHKVGLDIVPFAPRSEAQIRDLLIQRIRADLVIDVGANKGQYGSMIRQSGYRGAILSLEPMTEAFGILQGRAAQDPSWRTLQCGAGEANAQTEINIAGNSYSSSILPMNASHSDALRESAYVGRERITIRRLDDVLTELGLSGRRAYMKIDTQGFEDRVLRGASGIMHDVHAVELEASFVNLYDGQMLFEELHRHVTSSGYFLAHIEPGFSDETTGELLQADAIYLKRQQDFP
jgi:FkbM family methyltransferase